MSGRTLPAVVATLMLAFVPAATAIAEPYSLGTCPVMGTDLANVDEPIVVTLEGRELRVCCAGCETALKNNPAEHLDELDAREVERQLPWYPLDTSVVSGSELPEDAVNHIHRNRLVRLADASEAAEFKEDPARYIAKLDKAVVEAQKDDYPLDTCVVMGVELGGMGDPVDYVIANRLVRFCCRGCVGAFERDPAKHLRKLDEAYAAGE